LVSKFTKAQISWLKLAIEFSNRNRSFSANIGCYDVQCVDHLFYVMTDMSIYCGSPGVISSKFVAKTWIIYPCPMSELFWCSRVDVTVWAFLVDSNLSHCLLPGVWPNGWVWFFGLSEL